LSVRNVILLLSLVAVTSTVLYLSLRGESIQPSVDLNKQATDTAASGDNFKNTSFLFASSIYASPTFTEAVGLIDTASGDLIYDASSLKNKSLAFCNTFGDSRNGTMKTYKALYLSLHKKHTPSGLASAAYLDGYRKQFCDAGTDLQTVEREWIDDLNPDALRAIGGEAVLAAYELDESADDQEVELLKEEVIDFLSKTQSPMAFRQAALALSEGQVLQLDPEEIDEAGALGLTGRPTMWRRAGGELAFCKLSQCNNYLLVAEMCAPGNCKPNESLPMYYRRMMTQAEYSLAEQYADYLLSKRR
jgi:hypothetical protein